jgi:hypothetical protein
VPTSVGVCKGKLQAEFNKIIASMPISSRREKTFFAFRQSFLILGVLSQPVILRTNEAVHGTVIRLAL